MRLKKAERELVRLKYGGHCAYCGVLLGEKWHADHLEPVIRQVGKEADQPEKHTIGNMMPAFAPCNISKGRQTLEGWRLWITGHINSLNSYHPIYKLAKAHGLIVETGAPVIFHFEKVAP
jgi:5-methylcytosine-specific restriction endonuclease McrA